MESRIFLDGPLIGGQVGKIVKYNYFWKIHFWGFSLDES